VAEKLESAGHQIVLWSALKTLQAEVARTTKDCLFHDTALAKKGLDPMGELPVAGNFDVHCQDLWVRSAQMVFDQMNRFDHSRDWSFQDRSLVFLRTLLQWSGVLRDLRPDLVVFSSPPHVVYDFILLELAKRMGIQTLIFNRAAPILPSHAVVKRNVSGPMIRASLPATSPSRVDVDDFIEETVSRLRGDYESSSAAKRMHEVQNSKQEALRKGVGSLVSEVLLTLARELLGRTNLDINYGPVVKEKGKTIEDSYVGRFSGTKYWLQRIREWHYNRQLEEFYESKTSLPNGTPAIYVALARQPERSSNPQANIFTNQVLMVQLISQHLPAGWKIWVREHPTQFQPDWVVNPYRSRAYYEAMLAIPGVELVSMSSDAFDLIDSCVLVASVGGTVSVEAVARGKPALAFGEAWYQGLKGVFTVKNARDLGRAFETISSWAHAEPRYVVELLRKFVDLGFVGDPDHPEEGFPLSQEENSSNLAEVVLQFVEPTS